MPEIPVNAVCVTTTLAVKIRHSEVNDEKTYSTTLTVQTHLYEQIKAMVELAWERTCLAYGTDRIMQRKAAADMKAAKETGE